jgi:hypothetical protein
LDLNPKLYNSNREEEDLLQKLFKKDLYVDQKKNKKIFHYLQFPGLSVGFLNLTALSVVHAIPVLINGTV